MLGRPVLGRLGAATAPVLLAVVALVVALSRVSDAGVEGARPHAAPRVSPARPSASPGRGSPPVVRPGPPANRPAHSSVGSAPLPGRGPRGPVTSSWVAPPILEDISPVDPDFYDHRDDALLVGGTSVVEVTLPTEVTDPPGSMVDPPPPPVVASDLETEEVGPYSAVVDFSTDQDVAGVVGFGHDDPVNFATDDEVGRDHRIELLGLVPDTDYTVQVVSHTGDDKPELQFTTEPRPVAPEAGVENGTVVLDGRPFFPVTAYGACPPTLGNLLYAGVNVFQWEHSCGSADSDLLGNIDSLADRAYWTVPWDNRKLESDGLIGFTQPDEPDGLGLSPSSLPDIDEPGRVSFLTLTQHFAPGTGEFPWQYPGYYEALAGKADVLGVDFYPLQSLCSPEKLALNFDVQTALVDLAAGKPTLQWIEAAEMKCPGRPDAAITPETLRAEMLLAIAGGANGLGIFPARLDSSAAFAVRSTLDVIDEAWPMLLTPRVPVEIGGEGAPLVRASARTAAGGTTLVVVNASTSQSASVELRLDGVSPAQRFVSIDDSLEVTAEDGVLRLELEPLEAHILVAAPDPLAPATDEGDDGDEDR
jgi:hypothetical protein